MKNYKYIGLFLLSLGIISCDVNNELDVIPEEVVPVVELNTADLNFSSYVAIGASFTAGFTDNALFKRVQENSFPNILASKFGTDFNQPLMNDNIGGLLFGGQPRTDGSFGPRLFFYSDPVDECPDYTGPTSVGVNRNDNDNTPEIPTTEATSILSGNFNNFGIPGAKSFHLLAPGYGNVAGLTLTPPLANPYFVRMASSSNATVLQDAMAQNPTFFTLSEVGGNDVLGYALTGGDGTDPITPTATFNAAFNVLVSTLTGSGAKGVVANVPYITSLSHFTTVPYNALDPNDECTGPGLVAQIDVLNAQLYEPLKQIFTAAGQPNRIDLLSKTQANPLLIYDEDATDLSAQITGGLTPILGAATATAFGNIFGKARQATQSDLLVLTSSSAIASIVPSAPSPINVNGISFPLQDKWVLTPQEQTEIQVATDAYNATIANIVSANPNVVLVDFKSILEEASTTGIQFDEYAMTTDLVVGGLISLDGVHLTARGYALMANKILEAMDGIDTDGDGVIDIPGFGTNFTKATNGLAKASNYLTNYPSELPNN